VTDLGNLGRARVTVSDINDRGQVVGASLTRNSTHGFVWQNGSMRELGHGRWASAERINERSQIAGTSSSATITDQHAVLWQRGRMVDLRPRGGVTAINERGQVLGFRYVPWGNGFRSTSVIWENGRMRDLGLDASAINNRGQVVGAIDSFADASHAVMWQDGRIRELGPGRAIDINDRGFVLGQRDERVVLWRDGTVLDLGPGWPVAINERGQVIGTRPTPAGDWNAFLWQDGTTTDLGTLGGKSSFPTAISNRSQVVGFSLDKSGEQHAFLWQNGTMIELGSPKGKIGPHPSRTRAVAINEHNQIVGDNCFEDCGLRRGSAQSKFAVVWTPRAQTNRRPSASVAASVIPVGARTMGGSQPRNGDWIAYSTTPGDRVSRRGLGGSDVFIVRQGRAPMLVASRENGRTPESLSRNVCPAFSPDGTMLAFGTWSPAGLSVSVVRMTRAGRRAHLKVREGRRPPCPKWSADSSRLAYLRAGKVIVRGLDGSVRPPGVGDPVRADFIGRHAESLTSPSGDLVARRVDSPCGWVVERPDGTHRRVLPCIGLYAVAAWSPDGRKLLVMQDASGLPYPNFSMFAVSVEPPFETVPVVENVRVPNAHTWPSRFDVSWQPRPS
jgi:probable HAF family extracellular repeat protein